MAVVFDALVTAAWVAIVIDDIAAREPDALGRHGPVVSGGYQPPLALRALVLLATLGGFVALEHTGGRLAFRPLLAGLGLALAGAGVGLHLMARRALGVLWSATVTVRARHEVVARGPYAVVRHPLYLSVLLVAAGTALVHPSIATACLLVGMSTGIALKIRIEERALRRALPAYEAYAARVGALFPRLRRRSG